MHQIPDPKIRSARVPGHNRITVKIQESLRSSDYTAGFIWSPAEHILRSRGNDGMIPAVDVGVA